MRRDYPAFLEILTALQLHCAGCIRRSALVVNDVERRGYFGGTVADLKSRMFVVGSSYGKEGGQGKEACYYYDM